MRELTPEEEAKLNTLQDPDASPTKFHWDETFQKKLLGMLLTDEVMLKSCSPLLKPGYFSTEAHVTIVQLLMDYHKQYGSMPDKWMLDQKLKTHLKERDKAIQISFTTELHTVYSYYVPGLEARQALLDEFRTFAKVQSVKLAFHDTFETLDESPIKADEVVASVISGMREVQKLSGIRAECEGLSLKELSALPPPSWQIDQHVPKGAFVCLFGPAKNNKSFVALDWALCLASGRPYLDRFPVQAGPVAYVCSEGGLFNFTKRIFCWAKGKGVERAEFEENLQVFGNRFDFQKLETADTLMEAAHANFGKYPDTFIVDTLSRNFGAGDPNSNKDMQQFCSTVDYLREKTGATIIVVHHTGWSEQERERSASNLRDSVEVSIRVKKEEDGLGIVTCVAQKDSPEFAPYRIRGTKVQLTGNGNLLQDESLVFDWDGEDTEMKKEERERVNRDKKNRELARLLVPLAGITHPNMGKTQAQIVKEADVTKSTASRKLEVAGTNGLVAKQGEQQGAIYYLTDAGQALVAEYIKDEAIG